MQRYANKGVTFEMSNYLEQLVSEWYEFQGYFVRRNVLVGKRKGGGYECELDVVAFHPELKQLVQIEPSMDAHSWAVREERYRKKFLAGKKYIPKLFVGMTVPKEITQIALFGLIGRKPQRFLAGGQVLTLRELLKDICEEMQIHRTATNIIPENYTILRTIMFVAEHKQDIFETSVAALREPKL